MSSVGEEGNVISNGRERAEGRGLRAEESSQSPAMLDESDLVAMCRMRVHAHSANAKNLQRASLCSLGSTQPSIGPDCFSSGPSGSSKPPSGPTP